MACAAFVVMVIWLLWYALVTHPRDPIVQAKKARKRDLAARWKDAESKRPPSLAEAKERKKTPQEPGSEDAKKGGEGDA